MPLFLITSVCDEGVEESNFKVVEAQSQEAVARDMLDNPYRWENFLRSSNLWWDLTYYEYKYGKPIGWTAKDLLDKIKGTYVDGDSDYQVRIHEIKSIDRIGGEKVDRSEV